jgi:hypothetical protein
MHRVTASALHGTPIGENGQLASALVWGANSHVGGALSHGVLAESEAILDDANTLIGRAEWVQKSAEDLVLDTSPPNFSSNRILPVGALSLGYVREIARLRGATVGLGAMGTMNVIPSSIEAQYGSRTPLGGLFFLRVRPIRRHRMTM